MNKITTLLRWIERHLRFKWHNTPIASEKLLVGDIIELHRGFWGQLYARPARDGSKTIGVTLTDVEIGSEHAPYIMTHGPIAGLHVEQENIITRRLSK